MSVMESYKTTENNFAKRTGNEELLELVLYGMNCESHLTQTLPSKAVAVDIEARNEYGETALLCAARYNYHYAIKKLIDLCADVNTSDYYGLTALQYVVRNKTR